MTRKNRKRKMPYWRDNDGTPSPSPKRRTAAKAARRRKNDRSADDKPDLELWLSQSQESNTEQHPGASSCTITTEAEIHPEPLSFETRENPSAQLEINNSDTIDLDTASVKSDIKRVEEIINNNRNANVSEHEALIMLLSSIQENVDKIDSRAACLDEKIQILSQKVNTQEKGLNKAQTDIETLFKTVSTLELAMNAPKTTLTTAPVTYTMDVDEHTPANATNSVIISNLPSHNKDKEDVETLLYVGLCLDVGEVKIKSISRDEERHSRPGNLTVEFESLDQKIKVLSRKRRLNLTNEYTQVYIRAVKSHNELVMERNFSKVLQSLPTHNFRLASNGRIINRF